MPHPKTEQFKKEFEATFGKEKGGGTIKVKAFKDFAKQLIGNSRSCTPDELPALITDLEANLDTIAAVLANH